MKSSMPRQSNALKPITETKPNAQESAKLAAFEVTRYMKNTQPPDRTMLSTTKNFLPSLSICTMVQTLPGNAAMLIRNELTNTSLLTVQSVTTLTVGL